MECEVAETAKIMEENFMNKKTVLAFFTGLLAGIVLAFILFFTIVYDEIYDRGYSEGYDDGLQRPSYHNFINSDM